MVKIFILILLPVFFLNMRTVSADEIKIHTTVLAMGDSTTAGTPAFRSPVEAPPGGEGNPESQYSYWLGKRFPDWEILNRGAAGERTDQILRRLRKDLEKIKPQIVILLAGINDLYQGYETERVIEKLKIMYDLIEGSGAKVVVCTILPYDKAAPEVSAGIHKVNAWIRNYAASHDYLFCDTYHAAEDKMRPGKLAGSADGLHPDVKTYRKMGETMAEVFEKKIQRTENVE